MVKLISLGTELPGQAFDLKVEKTTVGRVPDNTISIPHASVSSHHCELLLRGDQVIVKDLASRNGTFINNRPVTGEAVLKVGEMLRLGQVEFRLETGAVPTHSHTTEHSSSSVFETPPAPKSKKMFVIIGVVLLVVIGLILYFVFNSSGAHPAR